MERLLDKIEEMIYGSLGSFRKQINSGDYKHFNECPNYEELKTLVDSSNIIRKYLGYETFSISLRLKEW